MLGKESDNPIRASCSLVSLVRANRFKDFRRTNN